MVRRLAWAVCFSCSVARADGPPPQPQRPAEHRTRIAVGFVVGAERFDGYTETLETFGFSRTHTDATLGFQVTGLREVVHHLWVGARFGIQRLPPYSESIIGTGAPPQNFTWNTTLIDAVVRYDVPFADYGGLYAQGALGVGIGRSSVQGDDATSHNHYVGPSTAAGAGVYFESTWIGCGFMFGYEYDYAPVIKNLVGDTHGAGGGRLTVALTERF